MLGKFVCLLGALATVVTTAAAASANFCFGWNTQNCQNVIQPSIPLINVGPIDVSCNNCYFETSGLVTLDLDPFKIGFENIVIDMVGEIDALATGSWSFDKTESKTVFSATIIKEGPITLTMDIPINVELRGSFKGQANGKIGVKAVGNIGSWESVFKDGHWEHIYPNPTWETEHSISGSASIDGDLSLVINPEIQIHASDVFEGTLSVVQTAEVSVDFEEASTVLKPTSGSDLECTVCGFLVGEVEQMVFSNKSIAYIENELSYICSKLTGSWQDTCNKIVENDIPIIVQFLASQLTPSEICAKLGLCTSSVQDDTKCSLCQLVVGEVETLLADQVVQEKIEALLSDLCSHLSTQWSTICSSMISQWLPEIIQLVEEKFPADYVCSKIGFCPSSVFKTTRPAMYSIRALQPTVQGQVTESFVIDWSGEIKLSLLHIDKTFNEQLVNFNRVFPFGSSEVKPMVLNRMRIEPRQTSLFGEDDDQMEHFFDKVKDMEKFAVFTDLSNNTVFPEVCNSIRGSDDNDMYTLKFCGSETVRKFVINQALGVFPVGMVNGFPGAGVVANHDSKTYVIIAYFMDEEDGEYKKPFKLEVWNNDQSFQYAEFYVKSQGGDRKIGIPTTMTDMISRIGFCNVVTGEFNSISRDIGGSSFTYDQSTQTLKIGSDITLMVDESSFVCSATSGYLCTANLQVGGDVEVTFTDNTFGQVSSVTINQSALGNTLSIEASECSRENSYSQPVLVPWLTTSIVVLVAAMV